MKLRQHLTPYTVIDGPTIHPWYRVAYFDPRRQLYVCYPIGLHLVIRFGHRLWEWFLAYRPSTLERLLQETINSAYEDGMKAKRQRLKDEEDRRGSSKGLEQRRSNTTADEPKGL